MSKFKDLKKRLKEVYVITKTHDYPPCLLSFDEQDCLYCEDKSTKQGKTCVQKGIYEVKNNVLKILPIIKELQQENIDLKRKLRKIKSTLK